VLPCLADLLSLLFSNLAQDALLNEVDSGTELDSQNEEEEEDEEKEKKEEKEVEDKKED